MAEGAGVEIDGFIVPGENVGEGLGAPDTGLLPPCLTSDDLISVASQRNRRILAINNVVKAVCHLRRRRVRLCLLRNKAGHVHHHQLHSRQLGGLLHGLGRNQQLAHGPARWCLVCVSLGYLEEKESTTPFMDTSVTDTSI